MWSEKSLVTNQKGMALTGGISTRRGVRAWVTDTKGRSPITAVEAAAFLGVSPGAIRQIVRRNQIPAVGQRGHAKVYWMHEIARHAGAHDRRLAQNGKECVTLEPSDRIPKTG